MAAVKYGDILKAYEDNQVSGDVSKWLAKVDMICTLQKAEKKETFLPMFLGGQALDVYLQLSEGQKADYGKVSDALRLAFAPNPFSAYEELRQRTYHLGESVDAFMADLKRLLTLAGSADPSAQLLKSAFVTGLPQEVRRQLVTMADVSKLSVGELMSRARAALSVLSENGMACATGRGQNVNMVIRCFKCNKVGHRAFECRSKGLPRCYACQEVGHVAKYCKNSKSGNDRGEASSVPEASPSQ